MQKSEVPDYVKLLEELPENVLLAMGEVNKSDDVAIMLPWAADLMAAHMQTLRECYTEGDFVTVAQLIPAMQEVTEMLMHTVGVMLMNYVGATNRDSTLIDGWIEDVRHYNTVTVEKVQANLMAMGWSAEHARLGEPGE